MGGKLYFRVCRISLSLGIKRRDGRPYYPYPQWWIGYLEQRQEIQQN